MTGFKLLHVSPAATSTTKACLNGYSRREYVTSPIWKSDFLHIMECLDTTELERVLARVETENTPPPQSRRPFAQRFQHSPLDHKTSSIRLVRILESTSPQGHLQCEIRHGSIEDTYTCLSYVWGEKDADQPVEIDGRLLWIRQNLWNFLASARLKAHICQDWLWIDAICIDQTSPNERNHQVKLMGRIFSNAITTISWLGMGEDLQACFRSQSTKRESSSINPAPFYNSEYWDRAWV